MNNKLKIFEKHLKMIKSDVIRNFTEHCILRFPDYFWTLPASTSGKRHGGGDETLIDHIQACLFLAENTLEQFKDHWTQRQKDQLISALILHDGWRCDDADGKTHTYTEEVVIQRGYAMDKIDKHMTTKDHPEAGFKNLLKLQLEYNNIARENKKKELGAKDFAIIAKSVRCHYGPFTNTEGVKFSLSWPFDSVVVQVHNIDFQQAVNSKYFYKVLKLKRKCYGKIKI